jgi:hypothetical protein
MALLRMKVSYIDGRVEQVTITPKAQVETERHFKSTEGAANQRIESHYFMAWAALHWTGREGGDFDSFLASIADVEELEQTVEGEKATDPTPATESPTGSSV